MLKHIRDSIYMVQEEIEHKGSKFTLDFLVDMELGLCSCTTGSAWEQLANIKQLLPKSLRFQA